MKMIINKINKNCDALEFWEARRMIELNLEQLQHPENYFQLNSNAMALLKLVVEEKKQAVKPLSRLEQLQIHDINKYSTEFDISMLKRTIRNSLNVLQRPDIEKYLNENAKTILKSMGLFIQREMEHSVAQ